MILWVFITPVPYYYDIYNIWMISFTSSGGFVRATVIFHPEGQLKSALPKSAVFKVNPTNYSAVSFPPWVLVILRNKEHFYISSARS